MDDKRLSEMAREYHRSRLDGPDLDGWVDAEAPSLFALLRQVRDEERARCEGIVEAVRLDSMSLAVRLRPTASVAQVAAKGEPMSDPVEVRGRITEYLSNGGLFNPELMQHDKVGALLIDCRDVIDAVLAPEGE
jgi:fermentation-respiration switch protein FrsA (DUF1100 family)